MLRCRTSTMSWCLRPSTWSLKVFMRKPKRPCASCWPVSSEGLNEFECKVLPFRLLPIFFNPLLSSSFVITIDQIKFFSYANFFDPPLSNSFVITIDQMRAGFQRIYDMMGDISIDVPQVSTDITQLDFQLNDMLSLETRLTSDSVHSLTLSSRLTWCLSVSCCGAAVLESSMMRWSGRWELLQWLKFIKFQSGC